MQLCLDICLLCSRVLVNQAFLRYHSILSYAKPCPVPSLLGHSPLHVLGWEDICRIDLGVTQSTNTFKGSHDSSGRASYFIFTGNRDLLVSKIHQAFNSIYESEISDLPKMLVSLYLIATRVLIPRTVTPSSGDCHFEI